MPLSHVSSLPAHLKISKFVKCYCYLLGMYSFREIREKRKSCFYFIKYANLVGKIGKVLDICISTIFNGLKRNKLRIIALPFLFQAIVLYSAANDPRPQMIPRPEMIPKLNRKWSRTAMIPDVDRKWSRRKMRNGMEFEFLD